MMDLPRKTPFRGSSNSLPWPDSRLPFVLEWRRVFWLLGLLFFLFVAIWWSPPAPFFNGLRQYAPLHTLLETFAVVVSALVFAIGWYAYDRERSGNAVILACAFLMVAILDVMHFLSYPGMPEFITPSGAEKAINFWLAARFVAVTALLAVVLRSWQTPVAAPVALAWLGGAIAYVALIFWLVIGHADALPRTFISGTGLTPFKIAAEWTFVAISAASAAVIWFRRGQAILHYDAPSLFAAAIVTILSELCFTLYSDVADVFNFLGHIYKVLAYALIYRALFVVSVRAPYARMQESEERYQRILDAAPEAMVSVKDDQRIVGFNLSAESLFGYKPGEVIGQSVEILVPESKRALYGEFFSSFLNGREHTLRKSDHGAVAGRRKDGAEVLLSVSLAKVELRGERVVVAMARDITEQRRAEELIRMLNTDLENRVRARTNELEAVNKELEAFSYSVSHDLRAPLRAIDGFSRILRDEYGAKLGAEANDFLNRICGGVQRMSSLIDDLLRLSQLVRVDMKLEKVDVSRLATDIARQFIALAPRRMVDMRIEPGMTAVADERLLQILLFNLIGNAWKYTEKTANTRIDVGVDKTRVPAVYFVRDNGAGFDMKYVDKLFTPFQRLHPVEDFPGSGIGLATAARVARRHGGRIWAEGEPEQGAAFYFTLGT